MLVQEWMTGNVITISEDTSMMKASRLIKENKIRRLPVVNGDGYLVGIISDRDIKDASPSKATTLEVHELYYLLSELKVKNIMTKKPLTARPTDSVEVVALMMSKNNFGGVPVIDDEGKVCGIITDTDIFKVLVSLTGVQHGGIQLAFDIPNTPGSLRPLLEEIKEHAVAVMSVFTSRKNIESGVRRVHIRLERLSEAKEKEIVAAMKEKFSLLYFESAFECD